MRPKSCHPFPVSRALRKEAAGLVWAVCRDVACLISLPWYLAGGLPEPGCKQVKSLGLRVRGCRPAAACWSACCGATRWRRWRCTARRARTRPAPRRSTGRPRTCCQAAPRTSRRPGRRRRRAPRCPALRAAVPRAAQSAAPLHAPVCGWARRWRGRAVRTPALLKAAQRPAPRARSGRRLRPASRHPGPQAIGPLPSAHVHARPAQRAPLGQARRPPAALRAACAARRGRTRPRC